MDSLWNYEKNQNIGFSYIMLPVLRKLYIQKDSLINSLKRHLNYFNTNANFAGYIVGITINLEEKLAQNDKDIKAEDIEKVKSMTMGPIAAMGDSLFSVSIRPLLSILAFTIILAFSNSNLIIIVPIVYIILYNAVRIFILTDGINSGYKYGALISNLFTENWLISNIHSITEKIKLTGAYTAGISVALLPPIFFLTNNGTKMTLLNFIYLPVIFLTSIFLRKLNNSVILFILAIICSIVIFYICL